MQLKENLVICQVVGSLVGRTGRLNWRYCPVITFVLLVDDGEMSPIPGLHEIDERLGQYGGPRVKINRELVSGRFKIRPSFHMRYLQCIADRLNMFRDYARQWSENAGHTAFEQATDCGEREG